MNYYFFITKSGIIVVETSMEFAMQLGQKMAFASEAEAALLSRALETANNSTSLHDTVTSVFNNLAGDDVSGAIKNVGGFGHSMAADFAADRITQAAITLAMGYGMATPPGWLALAGGIAGICRRQRTRSGTSTRCCSTHRSHSMRSRRGTGRVSQAWSNCSVLRTRFSRHAANVSRHSPTGTSLV
ncbi:hypothetical protein QZM57_04745 [Burkholderia cenocepacia]|nr:hypothetical protein [Burkholderia cenocepacia]MDN7452316.1 hypothetical protein [Burkholderia cenocepacia]